MKGLPNPET